jgi:uncharacterized cupredoxin-like copper-binding protein
MQRYSISGALIGIATILVACSTAGSPQATATSSATESAVASPSAAAGEVNVTLQEFSVIPDVDTVAAGSVTFHITNDGPKEVHEFVVIRTDLAPDALPTGDDGAVDEKGAGMEAVDEVEDLGVGDSQDLKVHLEAGSYVLICNIVDAGGAHYAMGMRAAVTAE